jgi:hypothetical protein
VTQWLLPEGLGFEVEAVRPEQAGADLHASPGLIRIGLHRSGPLPSGGLDHYDLLLSNDPAAAAPWVGFPDAELEIRLASICAAIRQQPAAAAAAVQVLRMTLHLPFHQALVLESLAYSMLLSSAGFALWREGYSRRDRPVGPPERVALSREAGRLVIRLDRPGSRNAFDAAMRDQLVEALEFARDDPDQGPVRLEGEGSCFSSGGDLDGFGGVSDPATAHAIRILQFPARLARGLGERLSVRLHGACIGAGIELPAAAHHVVAAPNTLIRLPELSMGLIPGAGGTATVTRRIGRWRTCFLILSGAWLDARSALKWGLVDELEPG